jgi:hypothetical protein
MKLLWFLCLFSWATFAVSLVALLMTMSFVSSVQDTYLEDAPKATLSLHKVFLPPMKNMQIFVFIFDSLVALYYVYQLPMWDFVKSKFPFFQYDSKVVEESDCSSFLLSVLLILLSKVSP